MIPALASDANLHFQEILIFSNLEIEKKDEKRTRSKKKGLKNAVRKTTQSNGELSRETNSTLLLSAL